MWFFSSQKRRPAKPVRRPLSHRPRLEVLEDRCLLSSPGSLDPTFGSGGLVTTAFAKKSFDAAYSVAVQADGKIIAAGNNGLSFEIARYNPNGTLDTSFGTGGKVVTQYSTSWDPYGWGFVLQPDGKVVVGTDPYGSVGYELVRYNSNGTLDTTFGPNHTGVVFTSFAGASVSLNGLTLESVGGTTKIVAGVYWQKNPARVGPLYFALARYNLDGSLDSSFGVGGEVVAPSFPTATNPVIEDLTAQPDGKIVVAGQAPLPNAATPYFTVARYDTSGNPDTTFGNGGLVMLVTGGGGRADTLAIQPDGKIVAGGGVNDGTTVRWGLARFNADGSQDTTFGTGGWAASAGNRDFSSTQNLVLQANGKIVAAQGDVVARYNADGSPDTGFGTSGMALMPASTTAYAVALQADGKIVAAGYTIPTRQYSWVFAVARFLGDPVPPQIGSFTASPNPVSAGSSVTLTAANVADRNAGGSVTQVAFYLDSNGDGKLEPGTDTLLGYASQTSPGVWTFTYTVNLAPGTYTLFAQAEDNYNLFSDPFALALQVI